MCKIAIVDKYSLFSSGIKIMLEEAEDFNVVAEAENEEELKIKLNNTPLDVIVINMLHCTNAGIHLLKRIKKYFPETPLLLITSKEYKDCFADYLTLGAKGFVYNNDTGEDLITSVKKLAIGEEHFKRKTWRILSKRIRSGKPIRYAERKRHILTARELSALKLLCEGKTFKQAGEQLFISPRTVETHKRNIMQKLEVNSLAALIKYATHHKLF